MIESPRPGWTNWLNLALATALAGVVCLSLVEASRQANLEGDLRIARKEAESLHQAFRAYHERHGSYPNSYASPRIDEVTLDPLRRRGYYLGHISGVLLKGRVDAYHSPDDQGLNQEYWVEMSLERDPSIRLLVADSDDAPLSGGARLNGVFVYRDGKLEAI